MPEPGGPTNQSGIIYQNSITALYLGRLLDTSIRPESERVAEVRIEAPESVDDTIVQFADHHQDYIQAKERIRSGDPAWSKLWKDFDQQFRSGVFQRGQDRLTLHIGTLHEEHDELAEMCVRAANSESFSEWNGRLNKKQKALLAKIEPAVDSTGLTDEHLLQLLKHVQVETIPRRSLERDFAPRWMPSSNRSPQEIFRLLRDRVGEAGSVRGTVSAATLRKSLLEESGDLQLYDPPDLSALQASIENCGALLRQHRNTLAETDIHIEREVVQEITEWLLDDGDADKNVAMLLDQAGMGKTVVMRNVVERLAEDNATTLAIKADQQLSNATLISEIQDRLSLPFPVEQVVGRLAQIARVVILVDQIDALSLSLAHDRSTLDVTIDLVSRLRRIPNVRVLISCRLFDRNTDPRLKSIEIGRTFGLEPFSPIQVNEVLTTLQINTDILSDATLELLRVPLHLDLFARIVDSEFTIDELSGVASLQELYALIWRQTVLCPLAEGPSVVERRDVITLLTTHMDSQQQTAVAQSLLQTAESAHLESATNWLASNGILLSGKTEWSFFHQTFFDYCYARHFVESGGDIVSMILASVQGISERPKLLQIIAYLRGSDSRSYMIALKSLLFTSDLRFHLFDVLLRWFGSLRNPTDDEWLVVQQMFQDRQKRWQILSAMHGNEGWLRFVLPRLEDWLSSENEEEITHALSYLSSHAELSQRETATVLSKYSNKSDVWDERLAIVLGRIRHWHTEEAILLYEEAVLKKPRLDRQLLWQIDDIAITSPETGCRLLRYIFDFALRQNADKRSQSQGISMIMSTYDMFNDIGDIEGSLADAVKTVSHSKPKLFVQAMLPWTIEIVSQHPASGEVHDWYPSDSLSHYWDSDTFKIQHAFVVCLSDALIWVAQQDRDYFLSAAEILGKIPVQTPQQLLIRVFSSLPESYAVDAYDFLMADSRRFDIGRSVQFESRKAIKAIYPYLSVEQRQNLEKSILDYLPIWKHRGLDALRRSGIEQYRLLSAIPECHLSASGTKRLREWRHKFPDYVITDEPRPTMEWGLVGTPIDKERVTKMSDHSWLRAMEEYNGGRQHKELHRGGARELASVFAENVKSDPDRFARLLVNVPEDVDEVYASAFITGFAEGSDSLDYMFCAIRRFANQEKREIWRETARAIKKVAESGIPDDILNLLIGWVFSPGKDDEWWWSQGENHGDAYHSYLNSDRGAAFGAAMRVLDGSESPDARQLKWQLIEFVTSDSSTALRIGAIHELLFMIREDRQRSWALFLQLIDGHDLLLESSYVREFLYFSFYRNFLQVHPFITRMLEHSSDEVQERGAQLACIAAISDGAMESTEAYATAESLAEEVINGRNPWRRGAAHIYAFNMMRSTEVETRNLCYSRLRRLIDDCDIVVREKIDRSFSAMSCQRFFELRAFIEDYALSELHPIDHPFTSNLWEHGLVEPDWSLDIVQTLLAKQNQPEPWRSGMEDLMRLVLQIYTSPIASPDTKETALNTFDQLMSRYAGTANKILDEWDRR